MFNRTDEFSARRPFVVRNTAGQDAPPYAALEVTGTDEESGTILVTRPTADGRPATIVCFNMEGVIRGAGHLGLPRPRPAPE
jgi:hypothetical protein